MTLSECYFIDRSCPVLEVHKHHSVETTKINVHIRNSEGPLKDSLHVHMYLIACIKGAYSLIVFSQIL